MKANTEEKIYTFCTDSTIERERSSKNFHVGNLPFHLCNEKLELKKIEKHDCHPLRLFIYNTKN